MQLGRGFIAGEDANGAQRVVVLSDKLWRNEFAADPHVVGRTISLNGNEHTVVGVAPRSLTYPRAARPLGSVRVRAVDDRTRRTAARTSSRRSHGFVLA